MSCMRPTARILFLICWRLAAARAARASSVVASLIMARSTSSSSEKLSSSSSSGEHTERTASSISITVHNMNNSPTWSEENVLFAPTNGRLHVKASMKFGSQYGCWRAWYWRIVMLLFAYLRMAPRLRYASR